MAAAIWVKYKGYDSGVESDEGWQVEAMRLLSDIGDGLPECGDEHVDDFDSQAEMHGEEEDQYPWGNDFTSFSTSSVGAEGQARDTRASVEYLASSQSHDALASEDIPIAREMTSMIPPRRGRWSPRAISARSRVERTTPRTERSRRSPTGAGTLARPRSWTNPHHRSIDR